MKLADLRDQRVVLGGTGLDLIAMLPVLGETGARDLVLVEHPNVTISETVMADLAASGIEVRRTDEVQRDESFTVDIVIRSPGFPRRDLLAQLWEERGARFTTPTDLWLGEFGSERSVVAVTGTKGKSTISSLIVEVARAAGVDPLFGGNIGLPIWQSAISPTPGVPVVLEVSSYMAADITFTGLHGVLTSLDEDHVSWHGSVAQYHEDKLHLFTAGRAAEALAAHEVVVLVPTGETAAYKALAEAGMAPCFVGTEAVERSGAGGELRRRGTPSHVIAGLAVAGEAARLLGADVKDSHLLSVAKQFEPLPSRFHNLGAIRGVRFVDDALASNPLSAAAALRAVGSEPLAWLMGGAARGVSPAPLVAALAERGTGDLLVIALPKTGPDLAAALERELGPLEIRTAADMAEAVSLAAEWFGLDGFSGDHSVGPTVTEHAGRGGVVLFSPAEPTDRSEGTYVQRSRLFAQEFERLKLDS